MTDTERLDFLEAQGFTKWVGYDLPNGQVVWPVFERGKLRAAIDDAMRSGAAPQGAK